MMKTETKILSLILLFSIALIAGAIFFLSKNQPSVQGEQTQEVFRIDYSKGQKIGSDSAKVKLVEFSDYQCPACAVFAPQVSQILSSQGADVQFIYRDFPLPQHQNAWKASNAALSAEKQDKFWQMHSKIFATQNEWTNLTNPTDYFVNLANSLGLDESQIKNDIEKDNFHSQIQADLNEGNSLKLNATPTFFLNGKKLMIQNPNDLQDAVNSALQNP